MNPNAIDGAESSTASLLVPGIINMYAVLVNYEECLRGLVNTELVGALYQCDIKRHLATLNKIALPADECAFSTVV